MAKGTLNKVLLIGRLGQDPEIRHTQGGQAVASFSIATNESWRDKEGNQQERTDWHNCVSFGATAEKYIGPYEPIRAHTGPYEPMGPNRTQAPTGPGPQPGQSPNQAKPATYILYIY